MMEAIRLTMNSTRLMPVMDLPQSLHDREVDVIVLPSSVETKSRPLDPERKSMMGALSQYANPALRELEEGAWEQAAVEKYLEKMCNGRS